MKRDHADDFETRVGKRAFQFGDVAPLLKISRDLVVPGLDRRVTGLAGNLDFFEQAALAGSCSC